MRVSGDVEVADHGVRFPAANELDVVVVDTTNEEGSGAASTEGAGFHFVGANVKGFAIGQHRGDGGADQASKKLGSDVVWFAAIGADTTKWGIVSAVVMTKVNHATDKGANRAGPHVTADPMGNNFTFDSILLSGESQRA